MSHYYRICEIYDDFFEIVRRSTSVNSIKDILTFHIECIHEIFLKIAIIVIFAMQRSSDLNLSSYLLLIFMNVLL